MNICTSMRVWVAKTNRKVLLSSYQSRLFDSSSLSASSQVVGVLNIFAKNLLYQRYSVTSGNSFVNLSNGNTIMQPNPQRSYQVVVAATRNMGIGKNGKLPWNLPSDLKFFKEITMTTSDPEKKNAVVMGRKTWESIPLQYRPLPARLNVVLACSGNVDIATCEDVITCGSLPSALQLLAESPYCFSIEKVFIIGGGQILREALNASECEAIHMTEIETSIDCDIFIPPIDVSVFQPWYTSSPLVENNIRYRFVTYVRAKKSALDCNSSSESSGFKVEDFTFLPRKIFEKH